MDDLKNLKSFVVPETVSRVRRAIVLGSATGLTGEPLSLFGRLLSLVAHNNRVTIQMPVRNSPLAA